MRQSYVRTVSVGMEDRPNGSPAIDADLVGSAVSNDLMLDQTHLGHAPMISPI
jgi:hypothetical protein